MTLLPNLPKEFPSGRLVDLKLLGWIHAQSRVDKKEVEKAICSGRV